MSKRHDTQERRLWAIAYDEAGHAVVGYFCRLVPKMESVTIVETDDALGRVLLRRSQWLARRLNEGDTSPRTEVACHEQIMASLAGPLAQKRFTGRLDRRGAGYDGTPMLMRGSDWDTASDLMLRLAGDDVEEQRALGRWLQRRTENILAARWKTVEAVATALVEHRTIRGHGAVAAVILESLGINHRASAR